MESSRHIFLPLTIEDEKKLLFIGPFLSSQLMTSEILEIGEKMGFAPDMQGFLQEYYSTLPIVADNDRINVMIDAFCERVWKSPSFSIVEINKGNLLAVSSAEHISRREDGGDTLANIERLEVRYSFENELIRAVALGQQHKSEMLLSAFSDDILEKRVQDPIRNAKNYCIILNTLLRKAAEQGGVHPLHIDRVSSKLATKIEQIQNIRAVAELMKEIFLTYCRLVRKHSTGKYSNVVKNTVLMIDADISTELSLSELAKKQGITAEYLATVFKKETGKTVIEYIRDKRINHAIHLLNTTNLQIQTIAMHCGIMDVQYFSKIFKRQVGKTPREYREELRS